MGTSSRSCPERCGPLARSVPHARPSRVGPGAHSSCSRIPHLGDPKPLEEMSGPRRNSLERCDDMVASRRLERLILYHLWACLPFGVVWALWPDVVGVSHDPREIMALRLVLAAGALYLAFRSWIVFRSPAADAWRFVWPLADVILISVALLFKGAPATSWLSLLYLLPVTQAAATLNVRWAVAIGCLAVASYLFATGLSGVEHLRYVWASFRLFFLVLMASLLALLARTAARTSEELAVRRYREELSREMHDGIQHYLTAISTRLDYARTLLGKDPEQAACLAIDQRFFVGQVADELRYLVRRLRAPAVEERGFVAALKGHLEIFGDRTEIAVSVRMQGDGWRLSPDIEHATFRIVQEALTNTEKHAQADHVTVELTLAQSELQIVVTDDGVGFDLHDSDAGPSIEGGIGLHSMRERAEAIGGDLKIDSSPGEGTTITLTVPLDSEAGGR
ncbi:MAG: hypothetical protein GF393_00570 [Armatimonadia bacterium]|nr:hypothetical protein [Armatimonadia bacterium]